MNRKSARTNSAVDSTRCTHRTPSGRRCRMPVVAPGHRLCGTHTDEIIKADRLNLSDALLTNSHDFQTAQGINFALGGIFRLLAANCVSARRASVLAFICSQLLRTLPAIDADNAAGIKGPTAPQPRPPAPPSITPPDPNSGTQPSAASAQLAPASNPPAQPSTAPTKPAPIAPFTASSTSLATPPTPPASTALAPKSTAPPRAASPKSATPVVTSPSNPINPEPAPTKGPS